jgi:hypothetical protein
MWKVVDTLSHMENTPERPTPRDAAAALRDAESSRARLAHGIAMPSWFFASLAVAVATQIATVAASLADGTAWALVTGLAFFASVAGTQLVRLRRLNGVWLGGFASRVVLGSGTFASASYAVALAAAIWAAYGAWWWLVALCSVAGGAAYALAGRRWLRAYRAEPALHARGESAAWLALLSVPACAGLVLLLTNG